MVVSIKNIFTMPYPIELKHSLSWGKSHQLKALDHVLVWVELSDGALGFAEAPARPSIYGETSGSIQDIIQREIRPRLLNKMVSSIQDLDEMDQLLSIIKNNNTAKGALNMALWSAYAESTQHNLLELLGATQAKTKLSYILGTGSIEDCLKEVSIAYEAGIRCLKVKIGKDSREEDKLIAEIYQAFPEISIYVDANQCLAYPEDMGRLERLAQVGVLYCEEALLTHQIEKRRSLKAFSPLPIIGDDSCFTAADFERELAFRTIDIVNIKTARTGFSHSKRIYHRALENKIGIMVGSQASSLIGCIHALSFALCPHIQHETEGSFYLKTYKDFTNIKIESGYVFRDEIKRASEEARQAILTRL